MTGEDWEVCFGPFSEDGNFPTYVSRDAPSASAALAHAEQYCRDHGIETGEATEVYMKRLPRASEAEH